MDNELLNLKRNYINILKRLYFEGLICSELLEQLIKDELIESS